MKFFLTTGSEILSTIFWMLISLAEKYDDTKSINRFFYKEDFPVDIRHNIKIDRIKLKRDFDRA